jgi:O-antigen/teichoic acid export membrane protein
MSGILTYLFLTLTARSMSVEEFGDFLVFWSFVYFSSGGILSAFEPEVSRVRTLNSNNEGAALLTLISVTLVTGLSILALCLQFLNLDLGLGGFLWDLVIPGFVLVGFAFQLFLRGLLAGSGRTKQYSYIAVSDATMRVIFLLILVFTHSINRRLLGAGMGVATFGAGLIAFQFVGSDLRKWCHLPKQVALRAELFRIASITSGMVALALLISGIPFVTKILLSPTKSELSVIGATVSIARVPILLLAGLESVLIPVYHQALENSRQAALSVIQKLAGSTLAALILAMIVGALVGPHIVTMLFGREYRIDPMPMGFFCGATVLIMGGLIISPIFMSLNKHRILAFAWIIGCCVFVLMTLLNKFEVTTTVSSSLFCGTAASFIFQYMAVKRILVKQ